MGGREGYETLLVNTNSCEVTDFCVEMPIVPVNVKLKGSAKKSEKAEKLEMTGEDSEMKDVSEGLASNLIGEGGAGGEGTLEQAVLEEKREEIRQDVGVEKSLEGESTSSSTVFAALNAHASTQQSSTMLGTDQDSVVPAASEEAVSTTMKQPTPSVQKLTLKRTLLYPMQGVEATENNDGMAPAPDSIANQPAKGEAKTVAFDVLKTRNVSLAKGMLADGDLNSAMGTVMLEVIQENKQESARSLDEAVRTYKEKKGQQRGGGGARLPGSQSAEGQGSRAGGKGKGGGGGGGPLLNVNGSASNTLKNLLKVVPGGATDASLANATASDLGFNGGMNILDMLKNAKNTPPPTAAAASVKGTGGGSKGKNWQQESLLKQQQQQQPQPQDKKRASQSQSYAIKQQQQVQAFLKSTSGGKDVNYASSAAFNSPDVSEVPMPDFTGDMSGATFAKGGFFDS